VVDATGQNSLIARLRGTREIDDRFRFVSIWGYFEGSKYVALDGKAWPMSSVRDVPPTTFVTSLRAGDSRGWSWHIPLRESTSVGLVMPREHVKEARQAGASLQELFLSTCRSVPYLKDLLAEARFIDDSLVSIQDYSYRITELAGPGYLLVGDAAGFIDPVFSTGITIGCHSAYLAAWAIDRSIKRPDSTKRSFGMYASQLTARLELARSLAVPATMQEQGESSAARVAAGFENSLEQQLIGTVSKMTTRALDPTALADDGKGQDLGRSRFRVLDSIEV
jgi:flavin-dependent dehydrogenase